MRGLDEATMMHLEKPLLLYDGDCHFCRRWIIRWKSFTGNSVDYAPFQERGGDFPEIPKEAYEASVQLVTPAGEQFRGAEAVFRTLAYAPGRRWMLWAYQRIPGIAPLTEWGYRFVARHRRGGTSVIFTRWLFLRCLGVIYLIAFLSLGSQIKGLVGAAGILPIAPSLDAARTHFGLERYGLFPTLFWLNASDAFLVGVWWAGIFLSTLLILNILPALVLALLWALYLSLTTICREFLWFQWDILLLETGFLAIFFAPFHFLPRKTLSSPPSFLVLWLLRLLLFRLMFFSGAVKLLSGDPTWRNLTALAYHYETQPLPPWTAYTMYHLPEMFQKMSTGVTLFIELGVSFLIFAPRRWRFAGSLLFIGLQLLIMATGNYCFFNLLAIALCFLLFEDAVWPRRLREKFSPSEGEGCPLPWEGSGGRRWPKWIVGPVALVILSLSFLQFSALFRAHVGLPRPAIALQRLLAPFHLVNRYGLFAVMTTSRPEIIVEGSRDGSTWLPYEFKYKPGDVQRRPRFVAPHQPRLDWQMWFAALGTYRENPWFLNFCIRLLQGSPEVLALLDKNPFPDAPPRYIRAVVYDYRFTDFATKRAEGSWWRRDVTGLYCPILSLHEK